MTEAERQLFEQYQLTPAGETDMIIESLILIALDLEEMVNEPTREGARTLRENWSRVIEARNRINAALYLVTPFAREQ